MGKFLKDWKFHLAMLPVYTVLIAVLAAVFLVYFCFLFQFGAWWGPIAGLMIIWFIVGMYVGISRMFRSKEES